MFRSPPSPANTPGLTWQKEESSAELLMKEGIKMANEMQRIPTSKASVSQDTALGRRKTVSRLMAERKSTKVTFSLDENFQQTLQNLDEEGETGEATTERRRASVR